MRARKPSQNRCSHPARASQVTVLQRFASTTWGSGAFPKWLLTVVVLLCGEAHVAADPSMLAVAPRPGDPVDAYTLEGPFETLETAWDIALANDQRIASMRLGVAAAQSGCLAAQAEALPSLTLGADYIALSEQPAMKLPQSGLPLPGQLPFMDRESGGVSAVVTQPLYTFGRISSGVGAAAAGVRVNEAELSRVYLDVKMQVAEAYVAVLRAQRIVGVAESKATSLVSHTRDVSNMFDKGMVSKNDQLAAQVSLADAQQQWLQAQNGLAMAQAAYNRALSRPLPTPVRLGELPETPIVDDVDNLTQTALQSRPELAALHAQARALSEQAASTRAKNAPQIGLAGGYLYQENSYVEPNGIAGLALLAQWNVIDMGRASNQADALCHRAQATMRLCRDAESMIALEVRQRWLELQTARQRVVVAQQATTQADENLRVARDRYQHQAGTNTEVLDAETLRVQAHTNFFNSGYEAALAALRLRRAIGQL